MKREPAPGDEVPGDEVPGDEVPDDEVPDDEVPDDEVPDDEVPDDEVPDDEVPDDEVPDDEVPDDEEPDDEEPDDEEPDDESTTMRGPTGLAPSVTANWPSPSVPTARLPRGSRAFWAKVMFGLVGVALIGFEAYVIAGNFSDGPEHVESPQTELGPPPAELPPVGSFVLSDIGADGTIQVTQWIRSGTPIETIRLSAYDSPAPAQQPEATSLQVVAGSGTLVVSEKTIGTRAENIDLGGPTTLLRLTYRLSGVVEESGSVEGRALATVTALDVGYLPAAGPAVVFVGGADVLNLTCAHPTTGLPLSRPCGTPQGAGWQVRLSGEDRSDRISAQVDLR